MDGLDYQRLLPRYHAWLKEHPPKKVPLLEKLLSMFNHPPTKPPPLNIRSYTIPKDILNIIVSHLPFNARQNWRTVSKYWHNYVDIKTPFWKEAERNVIEKEFPPIIKNIFGGSLGIQQLPTFHFNRFESMEDFENRNRFRVRYHINFLKPRHLKHAVSRGIAPDGTYFFCLVIRNITLNNAMIMTIHETSEGWTASISPWNFDYFAPFSEDITIHKEKQTVVADPEFESAMRMLLQGKRIQRAIGNMVHVMCEYEISHPRYVPNWNWDNY